MNPVDLLIAATAAEAGRAQRRREHRHVHLERRPIAIAAMQMSIESHAIWGALVGTDVGAPALMVAPEPRTPSIAFGAMAELAKVICDAVDAASVAPRVQIQRRNRPPRERCSTAPQLLVANEAVVGLIDRLGRRMRPAGYGGHVTVPPEVNIAGAHLGFYAEQARRPGSALMVVATRELSHHFATGQSSFEDAHLGAQLGWFDPTHVEGIAPGIAEGRNLPRLHGSDAAALIERVPMSVLTDPEQDNGPLVEAVARFNEGRAGSTDPALVARLGGEVRELLREALKPTWRALWIGYETLDALSPAASTDERWADDLDAFTRHADYIARGGRRASVDSARRAALVIADWEAAQARYERDEVLEDGYALLGAIADGRAIRGEVLAVDPTNQELGPSGRRRVSRPLVTLELPDDCPFPEGADLWWTDRTGLRAVVQSVVPAGSGGASVVLKVVEGMGGSALPTVGTTACFSIYHSGWSPNAPLPSQTPWTHTAPPGNTADDSSELDDGPSIDGMLGLGTPADAEAS